MAIELITGRYGTAHIGSEDVRAYQAYTAGSGRYVLHGGGASIQSANDVHLNPAEILIDGAHVRITGQGEDMTLENGASSYNRVDIVALHYLMTGSGDAAVESVTLEVVKGTPSELTPSDPDMPASGSILDNVTETYVPYVRVLIQGLTPQTPEVLLPSYFNPADPSGDGEQVNPSVLVNLASDSADTVFKESPRPGVTGTLPVSKGGTGVASEPSLLVNLGSSGAAGVFQKSPRPGVTGTLPVSKGGTGAMDAAGARSNLRAAGVETDTTSGTIWSDDTYDQRVCVRSIGAAGNFSFCVNDDGLYLFDHTAQSSEWVMYPVALLWSGSFSSGSITVPNLSVYRMLYVTLTVSGVSRQALALRTGITSSNFTVVGADYNESIFVIGGSLNASGNTLSHGNGVYRASISGTYNETRTTIRSIYGIA